MHCLCCTWFSVAVTGEAIGTATEPLVECVLELVWHTETDRDVGGDLVDVPFDGVGLVSITLGAVITGTQERAEHKLGRANELATVNVSELACTPVTDTFLQERQTSDAVFSSLVTRFELMSPQLIRTGLLIETTEVFATGDILELTSATPFERSLKSSPTASVFPMSQSLTPGLVVAVL